MAIPPGAHWHAWPLRIIWIVSWAARLRADPKGKVSRRDHCAYHGALLGSGASLKPIQSVTSNHLVRFRSTSPRKNLPPSISRKRAEANFLCSFERAFVAGHCQTKQITWRDFALQGYGIPDLITFAMEH